jgi:exopolysaccharide biosynthesis WecB/TagA/CpsF family protein
MSIGRSATATADQPTLLAMRKLLDHIHVIESEDGEEDFIKSLSRLDGILVISFFNQYAFNLAFRDPAFRGALTSSKYLMRDGVGVEICLTLLGQPAGRNLNGTDLIPKVLKSLHGNTIAVFGTSNQWLTPAVSNIRASGGQVVISLDGFQPSSEYINAMTTFDPDVILLGMGMPRQELLASELARRSTRPRLIINGGAILDFYAARFPRAPAWIRQLRMEWLYRFYREPRRLARRYFVGGVLFGWRLFQLWKMKFYTRVGPNRNGCGDFSNGGRDTTSMRDVK